MTQKTRECLKKANIFFRVQKSTTRHLSLSESVLKIVIFFLNLYLDYFENKLV